VGDCGGGGRADDVAAPRDRPEWKAKWVTW
jgi:hypothetical protein